MAINIGSLFASLTLQHEQFTTGMRNATHDAKTAEDRIVHSFEHIKEAAKLAMEAFAVYELAEFTHKTLEHTAALGEMAKKIGVTVESYQELKYAASQTGVKQEELDGALLKLSATIGKAEVGSSKAGKALMALGYTADDVKRHNISAVDAYLKLSDAAKKLGDDHRASALEVALLGKAGQSNAPLLREGSEKIKQFAEAAHSLGIVLSEQQIQNAEQTAHKLEQVKEVLSARIAGVVADNARAIYSLADSFMHLAVGIANFWAKNPMKAFGLIGAFAGGRLGAAGGPIGIGVGATAGYYLGKHMAPDGPAKLREQAQEHIDMVKQWGSYAGYQQGRLSPRDKQFLALPRVQEELTAAKSLIAQAKKLESSENLGMPHGAEGGDVSMPNFMGGGGHHPRAKKEKDPDKAAKDMIENLKFEDAQLGRTAKQQAEYNNLKQAGVSATSAFGKEIISLTDKLFDDKGWTEYNKQLDEAIENYKKLEAEIGMTDRQKALYELELERQKQEKAYGKEHPDDPNGAIVVNGKFSRLKLAANDFYDKQAMHDQAEQAKKDFAEMQDQIKAAYDEQAQEAHDLGEKFGDIATGFLENIMDGTKSWADVMKSAITDIGKLMLEELVYKPLREMIAKGIANLLMSLTGGNPLSGFNAEAPYIHGNFADPFGGSFAPVGHADGGSSAAGRPYWVGERGPELFVPNVSGRIVANDNVGGGGTVINIDARGSNNPEETRRLVAEGIMTAMPTILRSSSDNTTKRLVRPRLGV